MRFDLRLRFCMTSVLRFTLLWLLSACVFVDFFLVSRLEPDQLRAGQAADVQMGERVAGDAVDFAASVQAMTNTSHTNLVAFRDNLPGETFLRRPSFPRRLGERKMDQQASEGFFYIGPPDLFTSSSFQRHEAKTRALTLRPMDSNKMLNPNTASTHEKSTARRSPTSSHCRFRAF